MFALLVAGFNTGLIWFWYCVWCLRYLVGKWWGSACYVLCSLPVLLVLVGMSLVFFRLVVVGFDLVVGCSGYFVLCCWGCCGLLLFWWLVIAAN